MEFSSCFISYSTKDQEFADRLLTDLQNNGVRCWFAPHDVRGGLKLHDQIDDAIRLHDKLLLILSPNSINSEWVKTEIGKARQREVRENRRTLFPIRLVDFETLRDWKCFDGDTGKDSAREIREYFIPDFSKWKDHDAYKKAFDRLLRDLRPEATKVKLTVERKDHLYGGEIVFVDGSNLRNCWIRDHNPGPIGSGWNEASVGFARTLEAAMNHNTNRNVTLKYAQIRKIEFLVLTPEELTAVEKMDYYDKAKLFKANVSFHDGRTMSNIFLLPHYLFYETDHEQGKIIT